MGKLLQCESGSALLGTSSFPSSDPTLSSSSILLLPPPPQSPSPSPSPPSHSPLSASLSDEVWESVSGLESAQCVALQRLATKGVFWKHPAKPSVSCVFALHYGGKVEADGNCLFTASQRAMSLPESPSAIRARVVARFALDYFALPPVAKQNADTAIRNLYSPDLETGWGVHIVQEHKLLAMKSERDSLDSAVADLVTAGMIREIAAEMVYKERCTVVNDGQSWAKYMSITGLPSDELDIITLQYTEEGLLSVDENREGRAAAFGDDIAIECLASEYNREIFVIQAHGGDAMVDENNCLFFLPHRPRGEILHAPVFLFMKGTGWCGAGADHYEPLIARQVPLTLPEKAAVVL